MSTGAAPERVACIGIGSNLDTPALQIDAAVALLDALPGCRIIARSSLYRSAPFGPVEQPDFINAVVALATTLTARGLLQALQHTETALGRKRGSERWGPRVIDLDLLTLADEVVADGDLTVPHPGIAQRNFVLLPLAEVAPDLIIPGLGPVAEIAVNCNEPRIERVAAQGVPY